MKKEQIQQLFEQFELAFKIFLGSKTRYASTL